MQRTGRIAIVGAGPRGTSVLERIAANLPSLLTAAGIDTAGASPLVVHVIDPFRAGGGRIWRADQSPLLRMNSLAMDTTLFLDPSITCHGPIVQGPTLDEWAASPEAATVLTAPDLVDEAASLGPMHFATRRLGGEYLRWCFDLAVSRLAGRAEVVEHLDEAVDLRDQPDGRQRLVLRSGAELVVDAVVLTLGHLDAAPVAEQAVLVDHAATHALVYLPPEHADAPLDRFEPGMDVIVRGFGLDFVDKLVLLTEGRGGRFETRPDGTATYTPSGLEPRLHVGSRRGVPYHSKLDYEMVGPRPRHPRFFTVEAAAALVAAHEALSFREHAWPLIAKEVAWGYYHELFHGHPDHVVGTWADFDAAIAPHAHGSDGWHAAVAAAVPGPVDRLDFDALDRPLAGRWFDDDADLQAAVVEHVRADLARRTDRRFSADLGAFYAFLACFPQLPTVLGAPNLSAGSKVRDFDQWWFGFFSAYASGPPPRRLRELLALMEAGIVDVVGAEMWASWDEQGFRAGSASSPRVVEARALLDARIPEPAVATSHSALVRGLAAAGEADELVLRDLDDTAYALGQVRVAPRSQGLVRADGSVHPARFALGPYSTSRAPAFARRGSNSLALRHNDIAARGAIVVALAGTRADAMPAEADRKLSLKFAT